MRWILIALATITMGAGLIAARAAPEPNCTKTGTSGRDILSGTSKHDVICAKQSGDYLSGKQGPDVLRGDDGKDTLVGGNGSDKLFGFSGTDNLFAVDGTGGDTLDGGRGKDRCFADSADIVKRCERIFRGGTLQTAEALSTAFAGQGTLAELLIEPLPSPVPGVTVTETITITIPGAPCDPGPPDPPAFC